MSEIRVLGEQRKGWAQVASIGVNAVGTSAILAVFVHTGGLTGAEVGITAATAVVNQKLLEAIFGEANVAAFVSQARESLGCDPRQRLRRRARPVRERARRDLLGRRPRRAPAGRRAAIFPDGSGMTLGGRARSPARCGVGGARDRAAGRGGPGSGRCSTRARERSGFIGAAYVLALAGGTGVGKSSLLNALAGQTGQRRARRAPHHRSADGVGRGGAARRADAAARVARRPARGRATPTRRSPESRSSTCPTSTAFAPSIAPPSTRSCRGSTPWRGCWIPRSTTTRGCTPTFAAWRRTPPAYASCSTSRTG